MRHDKLSSIGKKILIWSLIFSMLMVEAPQSIWASHSESERSEEGFDFIGELNEDTQKEETADSDMFYEDNPETVNEEELNIEDILENEVTDIPEEVEEEDQELSSAAKTGWIVAADGKVRYVLQGGSYVKNGWKQIKDTWYYFDESGYIKTGWLKVSSGMYYLTENGEPGKFGAMVTDWQIVNGKVFYFLTSGSTEGKMLTGWQTIGKYRYYFRTAGKQGTKGSLYTGLLEKGGQTYYLNENGDIGSLGKMLTGWRTINEQLFYFRKTGTKGAMMVGIQSVGGQKYYFNDNAESGMLGTVLTGWQNVGDSTYYFVEEESQGQIGKMLSGWQTIGKNTYYFDESAEDFGKLVVGWKEFDGYWYYFQESDTLGERGRRYTGWLEKDDEVYYLKKTGEPEVIGRMLTGWQIIGKKLYYFRKKGIEGSMLTGLQTVGNNLYYFNAEGTFGSLGVVQTGWQKISDDIYFFKEDGEHGVKGKALTGWQDIGEERFYFKKSKNTKGQMMTGWWTTNGITYYFKKTGGFGVKGKMFTGNQTIGNIKYSFSSDGMLLSAYRTVKGLLLNALKPVGSTLYIFGGGHKDDATRIGVNPQWKKFFNSQDASYNHTYYRYQYGNGLDCSGYVGWTVYNTVNLTSDNGIWCTESSGKTGELYLKKGWGSYKKGFTSPSFRPGDVVGYDGHVWMVLGKCSDGSYVILHSSPQGVKLAGTVHPKTGSSDSVAINLAKKYMKKYFSSYTNKLTNDGYSCGNSYLKNTSSTTLYRFRWSVDGSGILGDPDGYVKKSAEEILKDLLGEV